MNGLLSPPDAAPAPASTRARRGAAAPPNAPGREGGAGAEPTPADAVAPASRRRARVRRAVWTAAVAGALGAIASAGWWGPRALSRLAFFRVRRVEIEGARYASPRALVARLAVDTSVSVWADLDAMTRRIAADPLVAEARVERRLPGVLRVVVRERVPVAVVTGARGALVVYDATGAALPLAPSRVGGLDVPLAASADPSLLRALGALRADAPRVYARVLEAARAPRAAPPSATPLGFGARRAAPGAPAREHDELDFVLAAAPPAVAAPGAAPNADAAPAAPVLVRAAVDVDAARFAELDPVERDLARRGVRAAELDLRFRDQVVARLP